MILSFKAIDIETGRKAEKIYREISPKYKNFISIGMDTDAAWKRSFDSIPEEKQYYLMLNKKVLFRLHRKMAKVRGWV